MVISKNKILITLCSFAVVLCILGAFVCSVVFGLRSERGAEAATSSEEWIARDSSNSKKVLLTLNDDAVGDDIDFLSYYNMSINYTHENDPILPVLTSGAFAWGTPIFENTAFSMYFQSLSFFYGKYYATSFSSTFNNDNVSGSGYVDPAPIDICLSLGIYVRFNKSTSALGSYIIGFYASHNGVSAFMPIISSSIASRFNFSTDYRVYNRSVLINPTGDTSFFKSLSSENIGKYYGIPFNFYLSSSDSATNSYTFIPAGYVTDFSRVPEPYKSTFITSNTNFMGSDADTLVPKIRSTLSNYYSVATKSYVANNDSSFYNSGFDKGYNVGYDKGYLDGENNFKESLIPYVDEVYNNGYNDGVAASDDSMSDKLQAKYDDGFVAGKTAGYSSGYSEGAANANNYSFLGLIGAVIDAPISAFTGLLNFDILGVNMSSFVLSMLTLSLIIVIIKICMGG